MAIEALQVYLNPPEPGDELGLLKRRIKAIERKLGSERG
jgi:hypothetical protein